MDPTVFNQKLQKPYCVGQATASLVHMLGQHPLLPSGSKAASESNEEYVTYCNEEMNYRIHSQDSRELELGKMLFENGMNQKCFLAIHCFDYLI